MKVLTDESVIRAYAIALVEAGHDVERLADALGTGATDDEVADYAERTDAVLFTTDVTALDRECDHGLVVDANSTTPPERLAAAFDDAVDAYDETAAVREALQAWL
jgi:predicted nuclease of predicted toxin-antitoxin system